MHSKFICGITGVVRDDDGRVLLLRHRLWPPDRQWGFPTGYANKGERHEDTIAREVREETGLAVKAGRLLKVRSGFQYRIEVYYEATLIGGLDGLALDPKEVLDRACSRSTTCRPGCRKPTGNSLRDCDRAGVQGQVQVITLTFLMASGQQLQAVKG
jgi:ADP-ribose pyrophosphatase YjhB (NUDIX family)